MKGSRILKGATPSAKLRKAMSKMSEILGLDAVNHEEEMISSFSESSLSEYLGMLNEKYEKLHQTLKYQISELHRVKKSTDNLKATISNEIRKRENMNISTQFTINKLKSENESILTVYSVLRDNIYEKEAEFENFSHNLTEIESEIQQELIDESDLKQKELDISEEENQKESNSKERRHFIEEELKKFEEMQIVRETLQRELDGVRMEWSEISNGDKMLNSRLETLEKEEETFEEGRIQNEGKIYELDQQINILNRKIEDLKDIEVQLRNEISNKNEQLTVFRENNQKLEKNRDSS